MRKNKVLTCVVAAVAAAGFVTAGTLYASGSNTTQVAAVGKTLSPEQLQGLLLPASQHPAGSVVNGTISLAEGAKLGVFNAPAGMEFSPKACFDYIQDAVGDAASLDGYMQWGSRPHADHSDVFVNLVVQVPGKAAVEDIRAAAAKCTDGHMILNGRVTGDVTFTEKKAPAYGDASVFQMTQSATFAPAKDPASARILNSYGFAENGEACDEEVVLVGTDTVLFYVLEPDALLATGISTALQDRYASVAVG